MYYLALGTMTVGFTGLAFILFALMLCNVVETQKYSDSDLYTFASDFVKKYGGIPKIRVACCFGTLPIALSLILYGFIHFTILKN